MMPLAIAVAIGERRRAQQAFLFRIGNKRGFDQNLSEFDADFS